MIYTLDISTSCSKTYSVNSLTTILKHIRTSTTTILLIATITITVTTSIQPVFAPRGCSGCGDFTKLTGEFVQKVINRQQSPNPDNVLQLEFLFQ
jgi:hypothetical protein